ncbi:alpha/beta fold hydrolase [Halostagnicola bangensis]
MTRADTLPGVDSRLVETKRLETHLLEAGDPDGHPIVFLHGNVSSSRFFEDRLTELPDGYRAIALDFRGYGDSETKPVDATWGLEDFVADLRALCVDLEIENSATLVGWSNGGGVAMEYTIKYPDAVESLVLLNPVSPYGFGGTKDLEGTPCYDDYAGSGGGLSTDEFVAGLENRTRKPTGDGSPRAVLRSFYVDPTYDFDPEREESYVTGMLDTETGTENYPGESLESTNWPGVAPGKTGVNNAVSPKYCDLSSITEIDSKPPVLWLRGKTDQIVSNESVFDLGALGRLGQVPDWPGEDEFPPQPMVDQTRAVLEDYEDKGGEFEEVVLSGVGHTPHVEAPTEFGSHLESVLER